jgi:hypothetical protein
LLNRYKVLYLPDICRLSAEQLASIKQFVAAGGGLVMTGATSLYDTDGTRRRDFALGDLAGIRLARPDDAMRDKMEATLAMGSGWDLYLKARPSQSVLQGALAGELIPSAVYEPVEAVAPQTVVADIVMGTGAQPLFPGLVISRFGRGKVAYIPATLDAMYRQTRIRQFADFLRDVMAYVSPDGLPYEIDAPSALIANMMTRGDKRVLHLINWTGCNHESPQQNVYYIPPIENVVIRYKIPDGKRVSRVQLFVPAPYSQRVLDGVLHVTLPRVDHYQGVIVEMVSQ